MKDGVARKLGRVTAHRWSMLRCVLRLSGAKCLAAAAGNATPTYFLRTLALTASLLLVAQHDGVPADQPRAARNDRGEGTTVRYCPPR